MIEARELTKRYGDTTAVHSLSFTIAPGTGCDDPLLPRHDANRRENESRETSGSIEQSAAPYFQRPRPGGYQVRSWSSSHTCVGVADEISIAQLASASLIVIVKEAGGRPPGRWIWLLVFLPPGGFFFWGDWIGEHAPAWVESLVLGAGFLLIAFMTYRLQWPQGYRRRRRHVPKHRRDDEPL